MSYVIRALCTPSSMPGVLLAGIHAIELDPTASVDAQVDKLAASADVGVLLIEDVLYRKLSKEAEERAARRALPLLVPFPGATWKELKAEDYVLELLRRAIGYRVRLR